MSADDNVITLSVPVGVGSLYVVPVSGLPVDPRAAARAVAGEFDDPLGDAASYMLEKQLLTVDEMPVKDFGHLPVRSLVIFDASPDQLDALAAATHVIRVRGIGPALWPPYYEWAARAVAAGLARRLGVDLIDLFTPRVLTPTTAIESLPDSHSAFALTRWMVVPYSLEERGYRFTTHGLRRFGLPELQALDVPGVLTGAWTDVMCGIATRLLDEWIEAVDQESPPSFVEIPAVLGVSEEDVARAFGGTPRGGGAARVRLRLDLPDDPDGETFLTVVPPLDFARSAGEHAAEVSEALFGVQRGDIRVTERSEAMDQAIEVARAGLAQVRQRFRTGELDRGAELIVKHRLPTPTGGNENVWATISDWSDPALLLGTSMNDAQTDPSIRLGRPVRIAVDDVIDWALWRGDEGIVEGGWTNRLLEP